MKLRSDSLVSLSVPILRDLRVFLHALVVLSDLIIGDTLEMLNNEIIQKLKIFLRPYLVSSPPIRQALIYVESVCSMALLSILLGDLPHQCGVCLSVHIRAEACTSGSQSAGTGSLKGEGRDRSRG